MAITLRTVPSSLEAQRHLADNQRTQDDSTRKLSSGYRITRGADDAAGLAISEKMRSQIKGTHQAVRNAQDGISLLETTDGALNELTSIVQRVRELAVQSANGTLTTSDHIAVMTELVQLRQEMNALTDRTRFNGIPLLNAQAVPLTLQVGANEEETLEVDFSDFSPASGQLSPLSDAMDAYYDPDLVSANPNDPLHDIRNNQFTASAYQAKAGELISATDVAINRLNGHRTRLGAVHNRLEQLIAVQKTTADNMMQSESRIRDVDVASESARRAKADVLSQAAVSMLSQANQQPQMALKLLAA